MKGTEITPGEVYAIEPGRSDRGGLIRSGTAVEVRPAGMLVYTDSRGAQRIAHLARVFGPWQLHADSKDRATAAIGQLYPAPGLAGMRLQVIECGYAVHWIRVEMTAEVTEELAAQLTAAGGEPR